MEFTTLLAQAVAAGASDLFLSINAPPLMKVEGRIRRMTKSPLGQEDNHGLIYSILNDKDIRDYERSFELNKSLGVPGVGRFRINVFRQKGEPALVARYIKDRIPALETLGLPMELKALVMEERGLVLIVGGTGSGKSTTLASMIDHRNRRGRGHILTIEDPIEFIHRNNKCLVNQREVGIDTFSFDEALKNALREAPDVILIGELRDRETMKHAITYAETGHLCLATLHASNAAQALQRILNFFPEDTYTQLLQDLSLNLLGIVSQRLCVDRQGGRVVAVELMLNTPYIADLIEKGKLYDIPEAMERSKGRACLTFDDALFQLMHTGRISEDEALRKADSRNNFSLRCRLEGAGQTEVYPIKSEFTLNNLAPFDHYHTYTVKSVRVDGRNPDAAGILSRAIDYALDQKGLDQSTDKPDIEVQFVFGIKSAKGLGLAPVSDEGRALEHYAPETEEHVMLIISVVDQKSGKPVYRLSASRRRPEQEESEVAINQHVCELLESLPVGPAADREFLATSPQPDSVD